MSSSGGYAVTFDAVAGSGGTTLGDRIVPLPRGRGGSHYKDVSLALAYDDPTDSSPPIQVTAHCRFLKAPNQPVRTADVILPVGVVEVPLQPGELAVHIVVEAEFGENGDVAALVEYVGE